VFLGEDHRYPAYWSAVNEALKGLGDAIVRLPPLDIKVLPDFYRAADVTLIPSVLEATSLAALESMASGTPVIATSVGGSPEIIDHERTGVLVPPRDATSLAREIVVMRDDRARRLRLASAGLEFTSTLSWDAIAARVENVLFAAVRDGTARRSTD
jgi:glycosyltransferase involved in cell wall biosynthesis